jgi:hypothetical protein
MGAIPQAGLASGAALHLEVCPHTLHPEIFCSGELGFGSWEGLLLANVTVAGGSQANTRKIGLISGGA